MKLLLIFSLFLLAVNATNSFTNRKLLRYYTQRGDQGFETSQAYLQSVILTALAGAILAILCCFVGFVTCARTFWRGRHHKRLQVKCSGKKSVTVTRTLIFVCAGGVIVASIVGLVGNRLMSEGTRDFMDTIAQTADDIKTQERSITLKLSALDPSLDFTDLDSEVDRVVETTKQAKNTIFTIDSVRVFAVFFALALTLIAAAVGLTSALLIKSKLSIGLFIMGFVMMFLLWWTYAVHLPLSIFIDDICVSFDDYLSGKQDVSGPLQYFVQCLQTGSYISTLDSEFNVAQNLLNDLNATTTKYAGYSFDPTIPSSGTPEDRLKAIIDKSTSVLNEVESVMAKLPSEQQAIVQPYVDKLQLIIDVSEELLDLMQCSRLQVVVRSLRHSLCDTTMTGTVYILISNYLIGIIGIVLTFLGVFSVRRFEEGDIEYKERTLVQSISLIQAIIGFIAIATAGSGWGGAFIVGFFVVVVTAFGFAGAFYMQKLLLITFAVAEGLLSLVCLALITFLGYQVGTGTMGSTETKFTTDLIAIGIIFIPILIGFVATILLLKNFDRIKAILEGRGRAPSEEQLWERSNVYGTEGL